MKGVLFFRVTFYMTISGSHFMIEALLAPGERNHLLSAVIDQGSHIFLSLENSRLHSLIFLEKRLSLFALKLECTNVISIECNPPNTGSWRLSSTGIHDPFSRS